MPEPTSATAEERGIILVVEDDAGVADLERRRLERAGYTVATVATADAALARMHQGGIALMVLDYSLPGGISGLDLYRQLRAAGETLPVIVVTGQSNEATVIEALRLGVHDFVTKSLAYLDYLPEAVTRVLRQVRTEQRLAASERRFRATVEQAAVGIAQVGLDGRWLLANQTLCAIVGYAHDELLERTWPELLHPDDHAAEQADRHRLLAGEVPTATREQRARRRDGTLVWINRTVSLVRDAAGQPEYFMSVVEDITARRQAAAERERAEATLRFLAEAGAALAASLDYDVTLASVGQLAVPALADWFSVEMLEPDGSLRVAAMTHADPDMIALGYELRRRFPMDPAGPRPPARVIRTGESILIPEVTAAVRAEISPSPEFRDAIQSVAYRSLMCVALRARGRVLGALLFGMAESGRRYGTDDLALAEELAARAALAIDNARLHAETQAALRARDTFLSIASHELRTPVTSIKGFIQVLLRQQERGQIDALHLAQALPVIHRSTDRLTVLIQDLLDVSRIQFGRLLLKPLAVDPAELARLVVERYQSQLGETHRLALTVVDAPPVVQADPDRLDQVLANLLDNALKYSPAGGLVTVTVAADSAGVRLSVRDEGIGLPAGMAEMIFEPFGRAANAAERQLPGLGLGLYICRNIVGQHGGRIWAESAGEGRGTTVHVWLPTAPGMAEARSSQPAVEPSVGPPSPPPITGEPTTIH